MTYFLKDRGQSLVEVLVAVGLFVVIISAVGFLLVRSYQSDVQSSHYDRAVFLAQEAMEAVWSIRSNNWQSLTAGSHGLVILGSQWAFQGVQENLSAVLPQGVRVVNIEDLALDRKKITVQVVWDSFQGASSRVSLATYLTNWQKPSAYCAGVPLPCSSFVKTGDCKKQVGCSWDNRGRVCLGTPSACSGFTTESGCLNQMGCQWLTE